MITRKKYAKRHSVRRSEKVNVRVTPEVKKELEEMSQSWGISVSAFIDTAVEHYLKEHKDKITWRMSSGGCLVESVIVLPSVESCLGTSPTNGIQHQLGAKT